MASTRTFGPYLVQAELRLCLAGRPSMERLHRMSAFSAVAAPTERRIQCS